MNCNNDISELRKEKVKKQTKFLTYIIKISRQRTTYLILPMSFLMLGEKYVFILNN